MQSFARLQRTVSLRVDPSPTAQADSLSMGSNDSGIAFSRLSRADRDREIVRRLTPDRLWNYEIEFWRNKTEIPVGYQLDFGVIHHAKDASYGL
jgi:hypothetical protein